MSHDESSENDQLGENWFNNFEYECLEEFDSEANNMEERSRSEEEYTTQKLWINFQNAATAVAQLYKDRHQGLSIWIPFQNAASSVTDMYKDSVASRNYFSELGLQRGRQDRSREILNWLKRKRKHIRREDLIAFLCGKNPPQRNRIHSSKGRQSPKMTRPVDKPSLSIPERFQTPTDGNLQAFREALALQGLNGAMSNISVGYNRSAANSSPNVSLDRRNNIDDLNSFIVEEISRNCDGRKRTSSQSDVLMDSPTRKKSRHTWE